MVITKFINALEFRMSSYWTIMGGQDRFGNAQLLKVDDNGALRTNAEVAVAVSGLVTPVHDEGVPAYYGSTNNLHTITYKLNNLVVGVLTFTYVGSGASDNDTVSGWKYVPA